MILKKWLFGTDREATNYTDVNLFMMKPVMNLYLLES